MCLPDTGGVRFYAIGDVHGRYDLLTQLLDMIEADKRDLPARASKTILLGDYIDRGPQSRDVCELLAKLSCGTNFHCLRGNHEQILLDALGGDLMALDLWLKHGGVEAARSWGMEPPLVQTAGAREAFIRQLSEAIGPFVREWMERLDSYLLIGDYYFVHAGIRPSVPLDQQTDHDKLRIREPFLNSRAHHPVMIIHGHDVQPEIQIRPNRIGIDTGAWKAGTLTALVLENGNYRTLQAANIC